MFPFLLQLMESPKAFSTSCVVQMKNVATHLVQYKLIPKEVILLIYTLLKI